MTHFDPQKHDRNPDGRFAPMGKSEPSNVILPESSQHTFWDDQLDSDGYVWLDPVDVGGEELGLSIELTRDDDGEMVGRAQWDMNPGYYIEQAGLNGDQPIDEYVYDHEEQVRDYFASRYPWPAVPVDGDSEYRMWEIHAPFSNPSTTVDEASSELVRRVRVCEQASFNGFPDLIQQLHHEDRDKE